MKKMFLLFCFIALASLAANAHVVTVQFTGYCDGMYINNPSGIIFGGQHILGNCVNNQNGGGFVHAAAGYTYYTGVAYDFSDPLFGLDGSNSSLQYLLQVAGTVKRTTKCGWAIYYGPDGSNNYLLNYGTCSIVSGVAKHEGAGLKSSASR
jgi:hypothetical protein